MGIHREQGVTGIKYDEQCFSKEEVSRVWFQPGCTVQVTFDGRENHRDVKLARIEAVYPTFILVRIDTPKGPYRQAINKIDIVQGEIIVREVV